MVALLEADTYLIRKKVLKIIGEDFHIYTDDSQTELLGFCNKKAFKLKEDIRIYTDEEKTTQLISIKARSILDFSAGYDKVEKQNNKRIDTIKRKKQKT